MTKAIVIRTHGGPEVLKVENVAVGEPGPGELRIRQSAIGVNFRDCYVRSGLYKTLVLPGIPGIEGAGVVEAVGPGVTGFAPGDRIGYVTASYGSYAEVRLLPATLAVMTRHFTPGWGAPAASCHCPTGSYGKPPVLTSAGPPPASPARCTFREDVARGLWCRLHARRSMSSRSRT